MSTITEQNTPVTPKTIELATVNRPNINSKLTVKLPTANSAHYTFYLDGEVVANADNYKDAQRFAGDIGALHLTNAFEEAVYACAVA